MAETFDVLFKTTADTAGAAEMAKTISELNKALEGGSRASLTRAAADKEMEAAAKRATAALDAEIEANKELAAIQAKADAETRAPGRTSADLAERKRVLEATAALQGKGALKAEGLQELSQIIDKMGKAAATSGEGGLLAQILGGGTAGLARGGAIGAAAAVAGLLVKSIIDSVSKSKELDAELKKLAPPITAAEVEASRLGKTTRAQRNAAAEAAAEAERQAAALANAEQYARGIAAAYEEQRRAQKDAADQEAAVLRERHEAEKAQIERAAADGEITAEQLVQSKRMLDDKQAAEVLAGKLSRISAEQALIDDERAASAETLRKAQAGGDEGVIAAAGKANQQVADRTGPQSAALNRQAVAAVAEAQEAQRRRQSQREAEDAQSRRAAEQAAAESLMGMGKGVKPKGDGGLGDAARAAGRALGGLTGKSPEATRSLDALGAALADGTTAQELAKLGPAIEKALASVKKSQAEQVKEAKALLSKVEALAGQNNLQ